MFTPRIKSKRKLSRYNSLPRKSIKVYELLHLLSEDISMIEIIENDKSVWCGLVEDLIKSCEKPGGWCDQEISMIGESIDMYKGKKLKINI